MLLPRKLVSVTAENRVSSQADDCVKQVLSSQETKRALMTRFNTMRRLHLSCSGLFLLTSFIMEIILAINFMLRGVWGVTSLVNGTLEGSRVFLAILYQRKVAILR